MWQQILQFSLAVRKWDRGTGQFMSLGFIGRTFQVERLVKCLLQPGWLGIFAEQRSPSGIQRYGDTP